MTVGELIEKLRDYPRDMEVCLARERTPGGGLSTQVYDVDKIYMKEITYDLDDVYRIASDDDFDEDADVENRVVIFPEV